MKRNFIKVIVILFIIFTVPPNVYATSGCCSHHNGVDCTKIQPNGNVVCNDGTTSSTCAYSSMKKCRGYTPSTNSSGNSSSKSSSNNNSKANSNSSASSSSSSQNSSQNGNQSSTNKTTSNSSTSVQKSSDSSLSLLTIDNQKIIVSPNMTYETDEAVIDIQYQTKDPNATVKIDQPSILEEGENTIQITVTAEDNKTKTIYNLKVTRKNDYQDSNYVNETETSDNEESEPKSTKNDNEITREQQLTKFQNSHTNTATSVIDLLIGLGTLGGCGYGIYYFIKKKKSR